MSQSKIYVSVDIETTGPCVWLHKVIALGIYVGDRAGNELETFRVNFLVTWPFLDPCTKKMNYGDFETQCWDEFMSKQSDEIIKGYKINATTESWGWLAVAKFIAELDAKYGDNIVFVSDNLSFDISFMDYKLSIFNTLRADQEKRAKPMRYSPITGAYRSILSSDDMFDMIPPYIQAIALDQIKTRVLHDHNPVNDAKHNYLKLIEALEYIRKLNSM